MTSPLTGSSSVCFILLIFLFSSSPLFSTGKVESVSAIKDPAKDWLLYIGPIQTEEIDEDLGKIAEQFRIALNNAMQHLDYHHFHVDEKKRVEKYLYDNALHQFENDLSKLYWEQDNLELNGEEEKLKNLNGKIVSLRRSIEESRLPVIPDKKAISVREEKERDSLLSMMERKEGDAFLDLLIRPSINSYIVTGNLYLSFFPDEPLSVRVRFKPEQIEAAASEVLSQMKSRLLGRPWASVSLPREPLTVALFEEGERISADDCLRLFPGQHSFLVSAPGYYSEKVELFLLPGENRMIDVFLAGKPSVSTLLSSINPERIDIYLDGEYIGKTPIQVETNMLPGMVRGEQENFLGQEWIVNGNNGNEQSFSFQLQSDSYDREELLQYARKRFYNRFGIFLLSLPITMISYGNSIAYASAANASWSEELARSNSLWYTAYLGGLFLNLMLGGDMIVQLVNYIDRYERFNRIERR